VRYIGRYAEEKDLLRHVKLNSGVCSIKYDSGAKEATVVVEDSKSATRHDEGPFDVVIWASFAAYGEAPKLPGAESFAGQQYHTIQFKQAQFDEIVASGKKVVLVGGNKAAVDVALLFTRVGFKNFTWVVRKPYYFWKFEKVAHNRSLFNMLRGLLTIASMTWTLVSVFVSGLMMAGIGTMWTYGKWHGNYNKFHLGAVDAQQRRDMQGVPHTIGSVASLTPSGVVLDGETTLACDVIIWATGYESGMTKVSLEKDGKPFVLTRESKLYHHFVVPKFPVLTSATALYTTFGPLRATNAAEMAVYEKCVSNCPSEAQMESSARWLLSKNNPSQSFIFNNKISALKHFLLLHVDLMLRGLEGIEDFLWHAIEMFVLGKHTRLRMNILPTK
jgi:cation diffusion facilitator CzcD-associated flavoprotein CzcO